MRVDFILSILWLSFSLTKGFVARFRSPSSSSSLLSVSTTRQMGQFSHRYLSKGKLSHLPMAIASTIPNTSDEKFANEIASINRAVNRSSWISWWIQIVLSVISFVILSFANAVRNGSGAQVVSSGFFLSAIGVFFSFINCFTTWNFTRLCRRVYQNKVPRDSVVSLFRKFAKISVGVSLFGMFITLLGAEQIVGTLAAKVLSAQSLFVSSPGVLSQPSSLQALDIFLVQANTNCLVSHFSPLAFYLWLQTRFPANRVVTAAVAGVVDPLSSSDASSTN